MGVQELRIKVWVIPRRSDHPNNIALGLKSCNMKKALIAKYTNKYGRLEDDCPYDLKGAM